MSRPNGAATSIVCLGTLARAEGLAAAQIARRLREHALSRTAYNALVTLAAADHPLEAHQLAEQLFISPGAVTQLVDQLEKQGRIRRRRQSTDRRLSLVELTADGRRILRRATARPSRRARSWSGSRSTRRWPAARAARFRT